MKQFARMIAAAALCLGSLVDCSSSQVAKIQAASANYQTAVASINAGIAATAPLVATGCADIQKWAMLIAPFVPTSGKAQQYFGAANGAIQGYCQTIPTDIASTAAATAAAARDAQDGYNQVKRGT